MPRLCEFYGIVIYMYRPDHPPAQFHARYGEHWAPKRCSTVAVRTASAPR